MFGTENTTLLEIALYLRLCRAKIQSVQLTFTVNNAPLNLKERRSKSLYIRKHNHPTATGIPLQHRSNYQT